MKYWAIACLAQKYALIINSFDEIQQDYFANFKFICKFGGSKLNDKKIDSLIALRYLEIMIVPLRENYNNFVQNFGNVSIKNPSVEIKDMIERLKKQTQGSVYDNFVSDVQKDQKLKENFRKLILSCYELHNLGILSKSYQQEITKHALSEEIDEEATKGTVQNEREKFFNNEKIKELSKNADESNQHKIESEYKAEMKTFTNFFEILAACDDEKLTNEILADVAHLLEVEFSVLKSFFVFKINEIETKSSSDVSVDISLDDIRTFNVKNSQLIEENEKSIDEILAECEIENIGDQQIQVELKKKFEEVQKFMEKWNKSTLQEIRDWTNLNKGKLQRSDVHEAIAVMNRANSLVTGWSSLRNPQILTILSYFYSKSNHGIFYEVLTGEGKTATVSLLAVLKILMGEKFVDVITSNSVLAEEGMKSRKDFYAVFNVTVGVNNIDENYVRDARECYSAAVVYGTMGNFQGRTLRKYYLKIHKRIKHIRIFESKIKINRF